jgi:hypothetical protein
MNPRISPPAIALALLTVAVSPLASANPASTGQTGGVNMPDARMNADGVLDFGVTYSGDTTGIFATFAVFPRLEGTFNYARFEGYRSDPSEDGNYRDKQFHFKLVAVEEDGWIPQITLGATDIHGTTVMPSKYIVISKRVADLDLSLGYGQQRIDGAFGSVRWKPNWARGFGAVVEYDAHDYSRDMVGNGVIDPGHEGGLVGALEYDGKWWGLAATAEDGGLGGRAYLRFDFANPAWTPKTKEPAPLTRAERPPQPAADWVTEKRGPIGLAEKLYDQDFDSVDVGFTDGLLELRLTNNRISLIGRAVGRAARTALLYGPSDTSAIKITYEQAQLPLITYHFTDVEKLRQYFAGKLDPAELAPSVRVTYASLATQARFEETALLLADEPIPQLGEAQYALDIGENAKGRWLAFERYKRNHSSFQFKPIVFSGMFNDATAAFRYDLFAAAVYSRNLGDGLSFTTTARLQIADNLDDIKTSNESTLPHVRSDIALYRQEGPLKLENLYLAKYAQLGERVYGRFSAGLYEEMFGGAGTQIVHLPAKGPWATEVAVEYAKQRDYDGWGFLDYDTVTAIGSLHYRLPTQGITLTARGGRFLAGDSGVRFEAQRRLRSGFVFGAWYTVTDGNDITGPGYPGDPYYDKGVFASIPLSITLPYDSKARGNFSLAPWARDVGQMIRFPGDIYRMMENTMLLNTDDYNPLSQFGR